LLKELRNDDFVRYSFGVYYFSETAFWGAPLPLDAAKVAEKKYIKNNGRTLGYYSGLTLMNMVGLTNQVPNTSEITTVRETTRMRDISIGKAKFRIRRAKMEVTEENAPVLQLLELFNRIDKPLEKFQKDNLLILIGNKKIKAELLAECAKCFPKRALQNLKRSEIGYIVA
jgi:hypothetical protein